MLPRRKMVWPARKFWFTACVCSSAAWRAACVAGSLYKELGTIQFAASRAAMRASAVLSSMLTRCALAVRAAGRASVRTASRRAISSTRSASAATACQRVSSKARMACASVSGRYSPALCSSWLSFWGAWTFASARSAVMAAMADWAAFSCVRAMRPSGGSKIGSTAAIALCCCVVV